MLNDVAGLDPPMLKDGAAFGVPLILSDGAAFGAPPPMLSDGAALGAPPPILSEGAAFGAPPPILSDTGLPAGVEEGGGVDRSPTLGG